MPNSHKSHLLDLPRELRDMILDNVLLAGAPAPCPPPCDENCKKACCDRENPSDVPHIPWPSIPLRKTNMRLYHEVSERAAKLDIPLVFDILVLPSGTDFLRTWLNVPFKKDWRQVPMMVNVRVQPVQTDTSPMPPQEREMCWCEECQWDYIGSCWSEQEVARDRGAAASSRVEFSILITTWNQRDAGTSANGEGGIEMTSLPYTAPGRGQCRADELTGRHR
jgi:hypothetical protein